LRKLAGAYALWFDIPTDKLAAFWQSLSYDLGESEQKGLRAFYGYAAEIGVIETASDLRFWKRRV
jgi:predicted solute-binding protein